MSDIKTKVQGIDPNIGAKDVADIAGRTGNLYEALAVVARRAKMLSRDIKHELHNKLEEFAVTPDTIEEVHENKEQIEISKFYERLPNPTVIAMQEFLNEELSYRYRDTEEKEKSELGE